MQLLGDRSGRHPGPGGIRGHPKQSRGQ
jgi:hypothetical protein